MWDANHNPADYGENLGRGQSPPISTSHRRLNKRHKQQSPAKYSQEGSYIFPNTTRLKTSWPRGLSIVKLTETRVKCPVHLRWQLTSTGARQLFFVCLRMEKYKFLFSSALSSCLPARHKKVRSLNLHFIHIARRNYQLSMLSGLEI